MRFYLCILFLLSGAAPCSATDIGDVETAVMRQDFEQAKILASELHHAGGPSTKMAGDAAYFLGLSHLRLQEYSQAIPVFKELLQTEISKDLRDKTYLGLFDSYYQQGKYKKAAKTVEKLLDVSPKSNYLSLIYLKAARVSMKLSRWKEAKRYLQDILERFPDSFEFHTARQLLEEQQYFAVQVGAFVERERAQEVVEALQQLDHYAYIVETVDRDQQKFYRVRVGQLTALRHAERLRERLSQLGYPTRIYP